MATIHSTLTHSDTVIVKDWKSFSGKVGYLANGVFQKAHKILIVVAELKGIVGNYGDKTNRDGNCKTADIGESYNR